MSMWRRATVLAFLAAFQIGPAAAKSIDLTGTWRSDGAQEADWGHPQRLEQLPDAVSPGPHGTYVSLPYLAILRDKASGALTLFSDVGALWIELVPVAHHHNMYHLKDLSPGSAGGSLGTLHADTAACRPRPACFQITPAQGLAPSDFPIPTGSLTFYVPADDPAAQAGIKPDQPYGSNFAPLSADFEFMLDCYGLSGLDVFNVQDDTGCRATLFAEPDGTSLAYRRHALPGQGQVDIPLGWSYAPASWATGSSQVKTIDTGRELSNSDSLEIGVNASVNVFGFEARANVSVATSSKLDTLIDTNSMLAQSTYLSTEYALVLNRFYAGLSPAFETAIRGLKGKPATDVHYDEVIAQFGTHYANAVTFGKRGSRKLTLDERTITTLREKGTNIEAGLSAEYEGNGGGFDTRVAQDSLAKIRQVVSQEDIQFTCYGGGDCSADGVPMGKDVVPIFLDLRPLSDLLAPPFFVGDAEIYGQIRRTLAQKVLDAAYKPRDDLDQSTMTVVQAVNSPRLLCGDQAVTRPVGPAGPLTATYCCAAQSIAVPVVAALSLKGVDDPVTRPAGHPGPRMPISLGAGQTVSLSSAQDPAPFVSGVTLDYGFYWTRGDEFVPNQWGVYGPDLNGYCQAQFGDGWTGSLNAQAANCVSGSNSKPVDLTQVCQTGFGGAYRPVWSDAENAWACSVQTTTPVDASAWCAMRYGAGSVARSEMMALGMGLPRTFWSCSPGEEFDPNAVCGAMAGRTFSTVFQAVPDSGGNLQCTGMFVGVHTAAPADASVRTYPALTAFTPDQAATGAPVDVVVPLDWTGDAATTCSGVNLDLVMTLQTVPPEALLGGP